MSNLVRIKKQILPFATIYDISAYIINFLACTTLTKTIGTLIISAGALFFALVSIHTPHQSGRCVTKAKINGFCKAAA